VEEELEMLQRATQFHEELFGDVPIEPVLRKTNAHMRRAE
jgi:hypothetical protein